MLVNDLVPLIVMHTYLHVMHPVLTFGALFRELRGLIVDGPGLLDGVIAFSISSPSPVQCLVSIVNTSNSA